MGILARAVALPRAARSGWLLVILLAVFCRLRPVTLLGQNSALPIAGPLPLQQAEERAGKFEFEVASVRLNENWKYADPGYSLDSDDNYVPGQSLFIADASLSAFIAFAYKLDSMNSMIANMPKWTTRYLAGPQVLHRTHHLW